MKCHACLKEKVYEKLVFSDVFKCKSCGHVFRQYHGDVVEFHKEKYRSICLPNGKLAHEIKPLYLRQQFVDSILSMVKPYIMDKDCLEIGFGDGVFSTTAKQHVKNMACCELDENLAKNAESQGLKVFCQDVLTLEGTKYDVVVAFDVLEHILNITEFKDKMVDIVREYLVIQVPVNRTLKKANRIPQGFDGHSHYFNKESITHLFGNEFELELCYYSGDNEFACGHEMLTVWRKKC